MENATWREVPRSEMFSRVITAVDAAKGEAVENGDEDFIRLCDEELFPFLEEERARAEIYEMAKEDGLDIEEIVAHHKERSKRGY